MSKVVRLFNKLNNYMRLFWGSYVLITLPLNVINLFVSDPHASEVMSSVILVTFVLQMMLLAFDMILSRREHKKTMYEIEKQIEAMKAGNWDELDRLRKIDEDKARN